MTAEKRNFDVIIMGAGLSGIGTACHLRRECKDKSFVVLENRENMGGTWDLFRYPGIRSDSDMFTLGYSFKPWIHPEAIADGDLILNYINEAADEYDVRENIRFNTKINSAHWDSEKENWTIKCTDNISGNEVTYTGRYIISCMGYYNYEHGHRPHFEGEEDFKGTIIHPQFWPEDFDYTDKEVVIIGSGATAVTLLPAMTDKAKHVTMLQRSPTYIATLPNRSILPKAVSKNFPVKVQYDMNRAAQISFQILSYNLCRAQPKLMRAYFKQMTKMQLPKGYNVEKHFTPKYDPWDERVCAVPDGDLFKAIRKGNASIVTDHIDRFTEDGISLKSGHKLKADVIITATGLNLQMLGGIKAFIDGKEIKASDGIIYKGMMIKDVPNFAFILGYTNSSWSLKADLVGTYFCKLINETEKRKKKVFVVQSDEDIEKEPALNFRAGYVQRAIKAGILPSQGTKYPWKLKQNYLIDAINFKAQKVEDGFLQFQ